MAEMAWLEAVDQRSLATDRSESDGGFFYIPDKGCGVRESISLFWRYCAYKGLTGGQGYELLAGNLCSDGGRGVVIGRKLDEDGGIVRETSRESGILFNLEVVVEVSEDGSVGFVYEDEMATQILVLVVIDGWRRGYLLVEVGWNVLRVSLLGEAGEVLGEDVIERFEVLGSDGIVGERNGDRKLGIGVGGGEGVAVRAAVSDGSDDGAIRAHKLLERSQFDHKIDIAIRERRLCARDRQALEVKRAGGHRGCCSLLCTFLQRRRRYRQEQEGVASVHGYCADGYGQDGVTRSRKAMSLRSPAVISG